MTEPETDDVWFEKYKPIPNTVPGGTMGTCGLTVNDVGYMFETYGPDYEVVRKTAGTHPNLVWTLVDTDGDLYIINGCHYVNRIGYFIGSIPTEDGGYYEYLYWKQDPEDDTDD